MDDFLSEIIKKKSDVTSEVNEWQKEFFGKYHIKTC